MEAIETIEKNGYVGRIEYDEIAESTRTSWDNLGTLITWHRRYAFGDRDGAREGLDPAEFVQNLHDEGAEILPVYLYEHGGMTIRTSAFGDPWDSGQVGVIYVTREKLIEEYGADTPEHRETARGVLQGEVKELDDYLTGQVFGYVIEKDGEHVDSCWGFYGDLSYVREELNSVLDSLPHTLPLPEVA